MYIRKPDVNKCKYYKSFFGECELYVCPAPTYDHDDNEWVNEKCRNISDCAFKTNWKKKYINKKVAK